MAGMQQVRRDNAVTDPTLAADVNRDLSRSQRAVDARVTEHVGPSVAAAIAESSTLQNLVTSKVNDLVDVDGLTLANIALDTDGTPFYSAGASGFLIGYDEDFVPYFVAR